MIDTKYKKYGKSKISLFENYILGMFGGDSDVHFRYHTILIYVNQIQEQLVGQLKEKWKKIILSGLWLDLT